MGKRTNQANLELTIIDEDRAPISLGRVSDRGTHIPDLDMIDAKNAMPTAAGYTSFFGRGIKLEETALGENCQDIIAYRTLHGDNIQVAFAEYGIYIRSLAGDGEGTVTIVPKAGDDPERTELDLDTDGKCAWTLLLEHVALSPWQLWTYTILDNALWVYRKGMAYIAKITSTQPNQVIIEHLVPDYIIGNGKKHSWTITAYDDSTGDDTYKSMQITTDTGLDFGIQENLLDSASSVARSAQNMQEQLANTGLIASSINELDRVEIPIDAYIPIDNTVDYLTDLINIQHDGLDTELLVELEDDSVINSGILTKLTGTVTRYMVRVEDDPSGYLDGSTATFNIDSSIGTFTADAKSYDLWVVINNYGKAEDNEQDAHAAYVSKTDHKAFHVNDTILGAYYEFIVEIAGEDPYITIEVDGVGPTVTVTELPVDLTQVRTYGGSWECTWDLTFEGLYGGDATITSWPFVYSSDDATSFEERVVAKLMSGIGIRNCSLPASRILSRHIKDVEVLSASLSAVVCRVKTTEHGWGIPVAAIRSYYQETSDIFPTNFKLQEVAAEEEPISKYWYSAGIYATPELVRSLYCMPYSTNLYDNTPDWPYVYVGDYYARYNNLWQLSLPFLEYDPVTLLTTTTGSVDIFIYGGTYTYTFAAGNPILGEVERLSNFLLTTWPGEVIAITRYKIGADISGDPRLTARITVQIATEVEESGYRPALSNKVGIGAAMYEELEEINLLAWSADADTTVEIIDIPLNLTAFPFNFKLYIDGYITDWYAMPELVEGPTYPTDLYDLAAAITAELSEDYNIIAYIAAEVGSATSPEGNTNKLKLRLATPIKGRLGRTRLPNISWITDSTMGGNELIVTFSDNLSAMLMDVGYGPTRGVGHCLVSQWPRGAKSKLSITGFKLTHPAILTVGNQIEYLPPYKDNNYSVERIYAMLMIDPALAPYVQSPIVEQIQEAQVTYELKINLYLLDGDAIPTLNLSQDGTTTWSQSGYTSALAPLGQVEGITRGRSRLVAWDDTGYVYWGAPNNKVAFTPSPATRANQVTVPTATGKIVLCKEYENGFLIYTTNNIVIARFVGEDNIYKMEAFSESRGIVDPRHLAAHNNTHIAWVADGLVLIDPLNGKIQQLAPGLVDYIDKYRYPITLHLLSGRFVVLYLQDRGMVFSNRELRNGRSKVATYLPAINASAFGYSRIGQGINLYPTYRRALVFDMLLGKWGSADGDMRMLSSTTPYNQKGFQLSKDYAMTNTVLNDEERNILVIGTDGYSYVANNAIEDSYICFGRYATHRQQDTKLVEVSAEFVDYPNAQLGIERSWGGYDIDWSNNPEDIPMTELQSRSDMWLVGRWMNILIKGRYHLNRLLIGGYTYGRRL